MADVNLTKTAIMNNFFVLIQTSVSILINKGKYWNGEPNIYKFVYTMSGYRFVKTNFKSQRQMMSRSLTVLSWVV